LPAVCLLSWFVGQSFFVKVFVYSVKEIFYTLQGEGACVGRSAVFCRFAGCNLWSGREIDRAIAKCQFCDTNFVGADGPGGGKFNSPQDLAGAIEVVWGGGLDHRYVVMTGGEPLLQLDCALIRALHLKGFQVAIETNGTILAPDGVDWICVSPKAGNLVVQTWGHELKVVFPQEGLNWLEMSTWNFDHFIIQPMDNLLAKANIQKAIAFCQQNPQWRLGLQTHKLLGLP
jgi:7-carboxy-7-deazaguanine synthase